MMKDFDATVIQETGRNDLGKEITLNYPMQSFLGRADQF